MTSSIASQVPSPKGEAEPTDPVETTGNRDDTLPGDPLVANVRAARDTPAAPGASDVRLADARSASPAQPMGDTIRKG